MGNVVASRAPVQSEKLLEASDTALRYQFEDQGQSQRDHPSCSRASLLGSPLATTTTTTTATIPAGQGETETLGVAGHSLNRRWAWTFLKDPGHRESSFRQEIEKLLAPMTQVSSKSRESPLFPSNSYNQLWTSCLFRLNRLHGDSFRLRASSYLVASASDRERIMCPSSKAGQDFAEQLLRSQRNKVLP